MRIVKWVGLLAFALLLSASASSRAEAVAPVYPIVDMANHCLLGAVSNGRWLAADAVKTQVRAGERYRLYNLTRTLGLSTGSRAVSFDAPCPDTQEVTLNPSPEAGVIAIAAPWNAQPRLPRVESTNQAVYRDTTAAILRQHGIANPRVVLKQVLRVDIDGDGVNEVLVTATNYADGIVPRARTGDYSVVYLRKVVRGQVQTVLLDGDFYTQNAEFAAPITYNVGALVDTNGDSTLEVVVQGQYYEGSWSSVYRVRGTTVDEVLTCGCGA